MKILRELKRRKEDFEARIIMERVAQRDIDARLQVVELRFKNKARIR